MNWEKTNKFEKMSGTMTQSLEPGRNYTGEELQEIIVNEDILLLYPMKTNFLLSRHGNTESFPGMKVFIVRDHPISRSAPLL
ncbi:hypothetical protein [Jeotgalibacillus salarius]|uniref:Uncharacterized protein n=1 Tax=Jeotgalibacillus salarius TaxID=546023 RepID=A0A4Y8LH13_9BACL|nr:hypothetical protein [Jeotgalibacillus salarius]TFE01643.1 hypothetical protein E2626_08715 [Jeotgalibacillus salarius]